jgi:hypothetical protein
MKRLHIFFRWLPLYLIVIILIGTFIWEEGLPVSITSHDLIGVGLLIAFFFVINSWVEHNERNFIVPNNWLEKDNAVRRQKDMVSVRSEKKND